MASSTAADVKDRNDEMSDPSNMHQLLFALGRLKFSMRSLEAMPLELAVLTSDDQEDLPVTPVTECLESNKLLEKVLNEVASKKLGKERSNASANRSEASVEDLVEINEKLGNELKEIRSKYQSVFEKLKLER